MQKPKHLLKKILRLSSGLSPRERLIAGVALAFFVSYLGYYLISGYVAYVHGNDLLVQRRIAMLEEFNTAVARLEKLNSKIKKVKDSLNSSQLSFAEVTSGLDGLIKEAIGSNNYKFEPKRAQSESKLGDEFQKQEFSLEIDSLNLDQVVSLLFKLEKGAMPVFLRTVDIGKANTPGQFKAKIDLFSIRKPS